MFIRKKKYNKDLEVASLVEICETLLIYNKDAEFGFSRKYTVENNCENEQKDNSSVIFVSKPVEDVLVPAPYQKVNGNCISYWYDLKSHLATLVYVPMIYRQGKAHERQFLYTDKDEIKELRRQEAIEARRASYR